MSNVFVIAEAGVNHNGDLALAKKLVDAAKDAGADCVKFQIFCVDQLVTPTADKAEYQKSRTQADKTQWEMLKRLELSKEAHATLIQHARDRQIEFLSSPFDLQSADFLTDNCGLKRLKIASGEITNAPLLLRVARSQARVILSTGMSYLGEVEEALGVLAFGYLGAKEKPSQKAFASAYGSVEGQAVLKQRVTLLHCTTEYPAPYEEVNLKAMVSLANAFGLPVGYSDHTEGNAVSIAAAAMGASVIEKHLTLDRNLPGPDHEASLEPRDFQALVSAIRNVTAAMGDGVKRPSPSEYKNRRIARKSLVASETIKAEQSFSDENLGVKRPGYGISPMHYWDYCGSVSRQNYEKNDLIGTE